VKNGLRVAAVLPRKERGAFDPSCAPWPSESVGTKGVPQFGLDLVAVRDAGLYHGDGGELRESGCAG
jgi:hypothetical protein